MGVDKPHVVRTGGATGKVGSFGWTRRRTDGSAKQHNGTDYLTAMGQPIFAAHAGRVRDPGFQRNRQGKRTNSGYGMRLYIWSKAFGVESVYAHLSHIVVSDQQAVVAGQLIGFAGRTGNVERGCPTHLHFGVREGQDWVDPEEWINGR